MNNCNQFTNKTAWIVGADTVVGEAVARRFYQEGASLLLSGVENPPEGVAASESQTVICCSSIPLSEEESFYQSDMMEKIDILVTAVRTIERNTILDCSLEEFNRVTDENLFSAWCATRAIARKTGKSGKGIVLYVSSIHGSKPSGSAFSYSVACGGLNMLVKEASQDLGRLNIRVNLLRVGPLKGDEDLFSSEISGIYYEVEDKIPLHRFCRPEEIASAAVFYCSDESSYCNGSILTIDGGFTGHYLDGNSEERWDFSFAEGKE